MVVSGALSLGPTYHATVALLLFPLPSFLFRSFSFSLFHSEPSWLNPRLSYFTVKIVECSFRARGLCSFTRRKYSQSKHASELSISLSRAFSDFLDELSRDLPSEALMHPEERFGNVRFGSSSFFSVFYFSISLSLAFWFQSQVKGGRIGHVDEFSSAVSMQVDCFSSRKEFLKSLKLMKHSINKYTFVKKLP